MLRFLERFQIQVGMEKNTRGNRELSWLKGVSCSGYISSRNLGSQFLEHISDVIGIEVELDPPKMNIKHQNWWFLNVSPFPKRLFSGSSR